MSQFDDWNGMLKLPELLEVEVANTCNLRCRMCHVSFEPSLPTQLFDIELVDKLRCLKGCYTVLGSGFEPMLHPNFSSLVRQLSDLNMKLELITNATHCSEEKLKALADVDMQLITFSFDGGTPKTYDYIRRYSSYEKVIENIEIFKDRLASQETCFAINNTIMRSNLDETIEAINLWESLDIDMMRIITIVVRYPDTALIQECLYPIRDKVQSILDQASRHIIENQLRIALCQQYSQQSLLKQEYPNNFSGQWVYSDRFDVRRLENCRQVYLWKEHKMMPSYTCNSVFNFARILPNGDVQLCYKYSIGNLHSSRFEDIWFGEEANRIRNAIIKTEEDCKQCDAFRFCIGVEDIDMHKMESHFNFNLHPYLDTIDFQTGSIDIEEPCLPPRLISNQETYNIVYFEDVFIGVPYEIGHIELDKVDLNATPGIIVSDTYAGILSMIHEEVQRSLNLFQYREQSNYYASPTLLESMNDYNIVAWKLDFYGIPQSLGLLDLNQINLSAYNTIITDSSRNRLKDRIQFIYNDSNNGFIDRILDLLRDLLNF